MLYIAVLCAIHKISTILIFVMRNFKNKMSEFNFKMIEKEINDISERCITSEGSLSTYGFLYQSVSERCKFYKYEDVIKFEAFRILNIFLSTWFNSSSDSLEKSIPYNGFKELKVKYFEFDFLKEICDKIKIGPFSLKMCDIIYCHYPLRLDKEFKRKIAKNCLLSSILVNNSINKNYFSHSETIKREFFYSNMFRMADFPENNSVKNYYKESLNRYIKVIKNCESGSDVLSLSGVLVNQKMSEEDAFLVASKLFHFALKCQGDNDQKALEFILLYKELVNKCKNKIIGKNHVDGLIGNYYERLAENLKKSGHYFLATKKLRVRYKLLYNGKYRI